MRRGLWNHGWMMITVLLFVICHLSFCPAGAQSFTQRLQQSKAGEGQVTVTQDKAIDDLVNGTAKQAEPKKQTDKNHSATNQDKKDKQDNKEKQAEKPQGQDNNTAKTDSVDTDKKVTKGGRKVTGYRVQVFAGGNSRNDRIKAEATGSEIRALFPGVPVYVHFYSPRWICRMGNYATYEEAHEVLTRVKNLGYTSAIIVKGKITVAYQSE